MPSVFIEPTGSEGWTIAQQRTAAISHPILREYLAAQMRNQPACDRFYEAQQAVTKIRHIDHSEWQTAVRIPVLESLGFKFDGPDADFKYRALYHLLGAPTCLNFAHPVGRVDGPAIARAIDKETLQLVEYLVTLGLQEQDLSAFLELCKQL